MIKKFEEQTFDISEVVCILEKREYYGINDVDYDKVIKAIAAVSSNDYNDNDKVYFQINIERILSKYLVAKNPKKDFFSK